MTIENQRLMPTRMSPGRGNHIGAPDLVSIRGERVQALSGGQVTSRFFKRVEAAESRPRRVEWDTIGGPDAGRVQFLLKGAGDFTVTVDSAKGGWLQKTCTLPTP